MSIERVTAQDPRIQEAVTEIQRLIAAKHPEATFEVLPGEDPEGVYVTATVDTDDLTDVLRLVDDRLVDLQVDQGLPLYVVPVRPLVRVLGELRQIKPGARARTDIETISPVRP